MAPQQQGFPGPYAHYGYPPSSSSNNKKRAEIVASMLGQNGQLRYEQVDQTEVDRKRYEEAIRRTKDMDDAEMLTELFDMVKGIPEGEKKRRKLAPPKDRSKAQTTSKK